MVGKRLQLQERIGSDIAEIMELVTDSHDVAVMIEGCHSCMTARGIRKSNGGYDNNDTSWTIQDGSKAADESVSAASCRPIKHRKQKRRN